MRSGTGIGLFEAGGLIVDGGHGQSDKERVPPVLARLPFPEAWRVILVLDPSQAGVHGIEERQAFAKLPRFEASAAAEM